ncbi:acetate/propionate family kinase [Haliovirga abyssi]|uniref:Acetate kinase n=1 Tax=Haliovirga abyssi TaxID=2996794 RepID=A0AAU9DUD1_9FUSO|nr:acetate kinase [Haliovirga abyssi]BDU50889.1 acetate kinase [Haliovirga abyssi]
MNVLVLNSGSSSLKYQLFNMKTEDVLAKGLVERIGLDKSVITHKPTGKAKKELTQDLNNHKEALKIVLNLLVDKEAGVISSMDEINAVGHRVVHGAEEFSESALVTDEVYKAIEKCEVLAPLHNPANKMGISACSEIMPNTPQVAVFDTAFHQTMDATSYLYAIPYKYYEKYGVRRYGFHGTSHKYVFYKTAEFLGKKPEDLKVITCHIGNGASITAIDGGKVVDTSMGFTPLEGLVMGTRCGDLDPAILPFLMNNEDLTAKEMDKVLNKESGLVGLSGISSDMRDILKAAAEGDEKANNALNVYTYRVLKYIGAYTAALNGVDAVVFTAGIGENSVPVRKKIVEKLGWLGVQLDEEANKVMGEEKIISTTDSKVKVLVMPTDEEYMIAKDTYEIVKKHNI